jgi:hypothetical protein
MTDETTHRDLDAFRAMLDAFGADRSHWPAGTAARWDDLLSRSAAARGLLAEAVAFDRLLDEADEAAARLPANRALTDRILAAAAAKAPAQPAALPGNVAILRPKPAPAPKPSVLGRTEWRAAALLAASLLSGLYIGQQGLGDELLSSASETIGWSTQADVAALGLPLTGTTALEDDAL